MKIKRILKTILILINILSSILIIAVVLIFLFYQHEIRFELMHEIEIDSDLYDELDLDSYISCCWAPFQEYDYERVGNTGFAPINDILFEFMNDYNFNSGYTIVSIGRPLKKMTYSYVNFSRDMDSVRGDAIFGGGKNEESKIFIYKMTGAKKRVSLNSSDHYAGFLSGSTARIPPKIEIDPNYETKLGEVD